MRFSPTMPVMNSRTIRLVVVLLAILPPASAIAQQTPAAKNARILVVPRIMVSGDRATLAVLDVNGRLTPRAKGAFSNGGPVMTNGTGAGFVGRPLNPGVLLGTVCGRAAAG